MKYIGIDLAWTYKNETGLCIISDTGQVEVLRSDILSNEELVTIIKSYSNEPVCIAIDAPLIVNNFTGSRDAERTLRKHKINGYNLSLFSANRNYLSKTYGGIRGEVLLNLIKNAIPDIMIEAAPMEGKSSMIETFPTAVCCGIFPEIFPVKYKIKNKIPYMVTLQQMKILINRLKILEENEGNVSNLISRLNIDDMALSKKNLKHTEDMIDAFFCAYCVYCIHMKITSRMTFGDVEDGFITIPILNKYSYS